MPKLAEISPDVLEQARQKRIDRARAEQHVADVCVCAWPLVMYRNGTGHHDECPRHIEVTTAPRKRRG